MLQDVQDNTILHFHVQEALKESLMLQQANAVCAKTDCTTTLHEYVPRLWSSIHYLLQTSIYLILCLPVLSALKHPITG